MRRNPVPACFILLLFFAAFRAEAGQPRAAAAAGDDPAASMSIEELRAFQSYFFPPGGRDPLTMRFPTDSELGFARRDVPGKAPTIGEQEEMLLAWLKKLEDELRSRDYGAALETAAEAIGVIDNEWPPVKPEHANLVRMSGTVRSYNRLAIRLQSQRETADGFDALALRVEGVAWSPADAKAMVNGRWLSAGEVMTEIRKEGDLRVEMIEERGVVFQYKGMRFRLPAEIFSRLSAE